jgi:hypothetical protein
MSGYKNIQEVKTNRVTGKVTDYSNVVTDKCCYSLYLGMYHNLADPAVIVYHKGGGIFKYWLINHKQITDLYLNRIVRLNRILM